MKILTLFLAMLSTQVLGQTEIASGSYSGLNLAFDKSTKLVTGYYENATGWDEQTKSPRFTCTFYLKGILSGKKIQIKTWDPKYMDGDTINGSLEIQSKKIIIQLKDDHGGCWNVQHFKESPVELSQDDLKAWKQIRHVGREKIYFYTEKNEKTRRKAYLLKGDVVYVEKLEGGWAYCSFIAAKVTTGWLKVLDLNRL